MAIFDKDAVEFLLEARKLGQDENVRLPLQYRNIGYNEQGRFFEENGQHFIFAGFWKSHNKNYKNLSGEGFLSVGGEIPVRGKWENGMSGNPNGTGSRFLDDESFYIGSMSNGIPNGNGKIIFRRATPFSIYEGPFQSGKPHGIGTGKIKGTVEYRGEFKHGCADGVFECTTPDNKKLWLKFKRGSLIDYSTENAEELNRAKKLFSFTATKTRSVKVDKWGDILLGDNSLDGIAIENNKFYRGALTQGKRDGKGFALVKERRFTHMT